MFFLLLCHFIQVWLQWFVIWWGNRLRLFFRDYTRNCSIFSFLTPNFAIWTLNVSQQFWPAILTNVVKKLSQCLLIYTADTTDARKGFVSMIGNGFLFTPQWVSNASIFQTVIVRIPSNLIFFSSNVWASTLGSNLPFTKERSHQIFKCRLKTLRDIVKDFNEIKFSFSCL